MWSPTSRVDRRKADFENLQLCKANLNSISSCYRSHHRAFSCLIRLSWNRSENARIRSLSSALALIIFHFAQPHWMRGETNRPDSLNSILNLKLLSLRTDEAWLDRIYSSLRGISCCLTGKMYHLSHDQMLSTQSTYLFGEYYQAETQDSVSLSINSIGRASKFSVFSEQVHSSWTESGQASSMARVLPWTRAEKYATRLEPLEIAFQEASDSNSMISWWEKQSSVDRSWYHDWTRSSILLGGFQIKWHAFSESRSSRIQTVSRGEIGLTSVETISVQNQRSA